MGVLDQTASVIVKDQFSGTFAKLQSSQAQAGRGFDDMGRGAERAGTGLGGLSRAAGVLGLTIGVGTAIAAGKAALALGNLGIQSLTVKSAFENVTRSVRAAPDLLDRLTAAAGGTVTQMDLMTTANVALAGAQGELGRALADALPKLLEGARAAALLNPAMGDTAFMFNSLISGIKRGSPMLIDNTGIVLKLGEANERYAASIGKTVNELTAQERSIALTQATLEGVDRLIAQTGGSMDEMATSASRLKVAWSELRTMLGEGLAPAVGYLQGQAADFLASVNLLLDASRQSAVARALLAETYNQELQEIKEAGNLTEKLGAAVLEQAGNVLYSAEAINAARSEVIRYTDAQLAATGVIGEQQERLQNLSNLYLEGAISTQTYIEASDLVIASARDMVPAIDGISDAMSDAIVISGELAASLEVLRRAITGAIAEDQAITARSRRAFIGGVDVLGEEAYLSLLQRRIRLEQDLTRQMRQGIITQDQADYRLAQFDRTMNDNIATMRRAKTATSDYGGSLRSLANDFSGLISAQLQPTFSLSDLAPELVGNEALIDQHYRRLAAIALRGGEEIAKHQEDWQDTLALIPADIQAQGIDAIQQWAADKVRAYDQGLDYSLIDREAIKDRVRRQLRVDALREEIIAEIAAEMGNIPVERIRAAAGGAGLGAPMAQSIQDGVKDSIDGDAMVRMTAQAINAGAENMKDALTGAGRGVGAQILAGIDEAVKGGATDIINNLALRLAPSVARIIAQQGRRTGE